MAKFHPSEHKEEIMQALKEGATIEEILTRFPISEKVVRRYKKELEEGKPSKGATEGTPGGKLATVVGKPPAPIVFTLSDYRIELDPQALYESYLLYEDIKLRCPTNDSFSTVLKDGMTLL